MGEQVERTERSRDYRESIMSNQKSCRSAGVMLYCSRRYFNGGEMWATDNSNDDTSTPVNYYDRFRHAFDYAFESIKNMVATIDIFDHGYSGQGQVFSNICRFFEHDKLTHNKRDHVVAKQFLFKPVIILRTSKSMIPPCRNKSWRGSR